MGRQLLLYSGDLHYRADMFDHIVEINPQTSPILAKNVRGLTNIQYLLDLSVEEWLDANTPGWDLEGGDREWDHIPELQVWFNYMNAHTGDEWVHGPARFGFMSADHALLFKLTWG